MRCEICGGIRKRLHRCASCGKRGCGCCLFKSRAGRVCPGKCHSAAVAALDEARAKARLHAAAPKLLAALKDVDMRSTQAQIASTIGKRAGQADFLRGELERIGAAARAAIAAAEPKK